MNPLRALREARRLSAAELGRRAGVTRERIYALERHDYTFWSVKTTCRLADVLNVTADCLLGREPPPPAPIDALAAEDRTLLDAMEKDAMAILGPQVLRLAGGWRRIARARWGGLLWGIRDHGLPRPNQPLLPAVRAVEDAEKRYRRSMGRRAAI